VSGRGNERKTFKNSSDERNLFSAFGGRTPFLKGSEHGAKRAEGERSNERSE
jgi:hypothetical protein